MNVLLTTVFIVVNIPPCVAAVITALNYNKIDHRLSSFKIYVFFASLMQLVQLVLWFKQMHNLFLLHFFVPAEFVLLALFYQSVLQNLINKKIIWFIILLFCTFSIINSVFIQKITTFNSYTLTVENIILTIMSIVTFIILLNTRVGLSKTPIGPALTWINYGIFINFSTTLVLVYFSNFLVVHLNNKILSYVVWLLNDAATVAMHICFIVGLVKNIKVSEQH